MGWEYYPHTPPKSVKNGIKARSKRGNIGGETWWSERWIRVLKSFHMGVRLGRGRSYARKGQVISIDIQKGMVQAKVQGTRKKPYVVKIHLPELSDEVWDKVTDVMASQALYAAKLLAGEMPETIEEAFLTAGTSLFPESKKELETHCSCPDWANPCKHIAAVYFLLAEQFDEDPFFIFLLRGRTKDEIIKILRAKRTETAPEEPIMESTGSKDVMPLEECVDTYWEAGELDSFVTLGEDTETENIILKNLKNLPFTIRGSDIGDVLLTMYVMTREAALKKLFEEYDDKKSDI
ncbi:MAG: SWIM zinc finger family protein [Theionarchaea archaeon]|nr:SWIM zinc finger family protein [Theionarchaea archaeon]